MNKGIYYDTIFVLNTGRITSIGPHGEINWQVLELFNENVLNKIVVVYM